MKKIFTQNGFTLAELVIVIGISSIILMTMFNFGAEIFSFNARSSSNLTAQNDARRVLKVMIKELRSTSPSSAGAYPLAAVGTSSITFFSNVDSDVQKEQVRYFLQGTTLRRGVINPSGNPITYNSGSEVVTTLIPNVRNATSTSIFSYFTGSFTGTSTALVQPVSPTAVRFVHIYVTLDPDPIKSTGPLEVESQVTLRNLKDNL